MQNDNKKNIIIRVVSTELSNSGHKPQGGVGNWSCHGEGGWHASETVIRIGMVRGESEGRLTSGLNCLPVMSPPYFLFLDQILLLLHLWGVGMRT